MASVSSLVILLGQQIAYDRLWFLSTALNLNANDYETGQIDLAYAAAVAHGNFQFFYSFDLSYSWDAPTISTIVKKYATSSATYKWKNEVGLVIHQNPKAPDLTLSFRF